MRPGDPKEAGGGVFAERFEQNKGGDGNKQDVQALITAEDEFVVLRRQVSVKDQKGEDEADQERGQRQPKLTRRGGQFASHQSDQEQAHVASGILHFKADADGSERFHDGEHRHHQNPQPDVIQQVDLAGLGDEQAQNGREQVQADQRLGVLFGPAFKAQRAAHPALAVGLQLEGFPDRGFHPAALAAVSLWLAGVVHAFRSLRCR